MFKFFEVFILILLYDYEVMVFVYCASNGLKPGIRVSTQKFIYLWEVESFSMSQAILKFPLIFVSLSPPHETFAMSLFVLEITLIDLTLEIIVAGKFQTALTVRNLISIYLTYIFRLKWCHSSKKQYSNGKSIHKKPFSILITKICKQW